MPVIIRELVIRATVSDPPASTGSGNVSAAANTTDRESMVKEIVEQVLENLEKQKER
ncbi:MAG: DUF5908 family protein [Bacteroidota bacterium]